MAEPFIAEIRLIAFTYPPRGWAECNGQILSIAQNTALFSLLGTTYGGNGVTNFALPDLRGRIIVGTGQGPGLSDILEGEVGGAESITLNAAQMTAHNHNLIANASNASTNDPAVGGFAKPFISQRFQNLYQDATNSQAHPQMISAVGSTTAHENRQPHLALIYIIALVGMFPPRQ
jgi:microcystin-dependent protein